MVPPGPAGAACTPAPRRRRWFLHCAALAALAVLVATGFWLWQWNQARLAWQQAQDSLRAYDLVSTAASLDQYRRLRPEDAKGWFLAGRTARRLGRYEDATKFLERCQELGGVTDATRLEWDLLKIQQGVLDDAHLRLRQTIGPEHPDALLVLEALARGYIKAERLLDAKQACEMWRERQPNHPWPWLWHGWIFDRLGFQDKAEADYRRAVDSAPEDREARLTLADLLNRELQYKAAAEQFEMLRQRFPEDEKVLVGLATSRLNQGDTYEAIALLDQVLAAHPDSLAASYLRGKAALHRDGPAAAERWLRQAAERPSDNAEALYLFVQCLRAQQKDMEAEPLAQRLDLLQKDLARFHEVIRLLIRRADDAELRHEAGVIALRIGRTEEGVRLLESVLRGPGDHRAAHAALADHFRRQGDNAQAVYHQQLAQTP